MGDIYSVLIIPKKRIGKKTDSLFCRVPVGKAAKMLDIPWETLSRKISSALEKVVTEERLEQFEKIT